MPIFATKEESKTREAKARLNMSLNSWSKPPIPIFSKFQSGRSLIPPLHPGEEEEQQISQMKELDC